MTKPEKRAPHRRESWCTTEKFDLVGSPASDLKGSFCRAFYGEAVLLRGGIWSAGC